MSNYYKCRIVMGKQRPVTEKWTEVATSQPIYVPASSLDKARQFCIRHHLGEFARLQPGLELWKVTARRVSRAEGLEHMGVRPLFDLSEV